MFLGYSNECKKVIDRAKGYAMTSGGLLGTEHLIAGMLTVDDSEAGQLLKNVGVDADRYMRTIPFTNVKQADYRMSARVENIISKASREAKMNGQDSVTSMDLLFAILQDPTSYGVNNLAQQGIDVNLLLNNVNAMRQEKEQQIQNQDEDEMQQEMPQGFSFTFGGDGNDLENLFKSAGININGFGQPSQKAQQQKPKGDPKLKGLDKYGVDLTAKARAGKLDPVVGRKDEVDRIIQILSRRTKNNPVLIGEPGVGKSAIVEGLAQAIVKGDVPEMLKNKIIFSLDITSMVAGAKYRGEFEERIKDAIDIVKNNPNIILFIDEIHMIVGAGATGEDGNMDAANILKPQLARGELQTIGATTIEEYRKHIEKDAALERRFQPIMVEPPSVEDTILILKGLREKYEEHHHVKITDEAINAAANLSDRYINDRFLPDKAIDLIDEAASRKHIGASVLPKDINDLEEKIARLNVEKTDAAREEDYDKAAEIKKQIDTTQNELDRRKREWKSSQVEQELVLTEEDIAQIVSSWTKVPVVKLTQSEADVLLHLEDTLRKRVIGQEEAVSAVAKAVRRARVGIKDPKRPIGSFIFLGPTGVGKTELSKALAEAMFGDENLMIRIDMSEYMEEINVSKLIGSAPGYVGYDEGGQLTEKVRRNPYSVILFDEIEKAHPDVFNILLQILDDGRLTDSHGRTISFKNTIIIMTSNIGASDLKKKSVGFGGADVDGMSDYEEMKEREMAALKRTLKPEFINRIDDIVVFRSFEKKDMYDIAKLMANGLVKRLNERGIFVDLKDEALNVVIEKGFNLEYGARPLRRALQSMIEDELATKMLQGEFGIGDKVEISAKDGTLVFAKVDADNKEEVKEKAEENKETQENE
ncbi:MAG: ATP-dependent Clp protease ATP-binding subunit [Clostridia bacterium]|nr:ATP-dependent Clp protease ATP-binding subunit [Clostridia bacterium]